MKKITKIIISFAIFVLVTFAIDISCKKYCPEGFSCNLADSLVLLFSKIANPMLALFTILTVFIAWETWKTYEKQLSEIKQTNTLQLQPYFGFVSANVTWQYHTSESPQITVLLRIKNTGATSAINISNFKVSSLDFHAFPLNPTIDNNDYGIPLFLDNDFKQGWEGIEGLFGNYLPLHVDNIQPGEIGDFLFFCRVKDIPDNSALKTPFANFGRMPDSEHFPLLDTRYSISGSFDFTDSFNQNKIRTSHVVISKGVGRRIKSGGAFIGEVEEGEVSGRINEQIS